MNAAQISRDLGMQYRQVCELFKAGKLGGTKEKGRWKIPDGDYKVFRDHNRRRVARLKKQYVRLYWKGASVEALQAKTEAEFTRRGIIWPVEAFAEKTIYESLPKRGGGALKSITYSSPVTA